MVARLAAVFVVQLEADAGGHPLDGLLEGDVIHPLQEGEDVAALAAAEAVVEADLRAHVEARAALLVERAEPLERADPGALERHVVADDVREVDAGPDLVDVASTNESGHDPILGSTAVARLVADACSPGAHRRADPVQRLLRGCWSCASPTRGSCGSRPPTSCSRFRDGRLRADPALVVLRDRGGRVHPDRGALGRARRRPDAARPFAVVVGVTAALVQALGLLRWVFLVPHLARESASGADPKTIDLVFQSFHRYLGVAVGEHLGYLGTGAWTILFVDRLQLGGAAARGHDPGLRHRRDARCSAPRVRRSVRAERAGRWPASWCRSATSSGRSGSRDRHRAADPGRELSRRTASDATRRAETSVSEATWSTTTRRRAVSSDAAAQSAANPTSRFSGRAHSASASWVSTPRCCA